MTTIERQVVASTDDCVRRLTTSWFSLTDSRLWCGDGSASFYDYRTGARFLNITIPKAANIVSAYFILRANYYTTRIVNSIIRGEDADDAVTFSTKEDFDGRARTSANVAWKPPAWVFDTWYNSPNIKSIIQEIVNRDGWSSGHDLVIFWEDAVGYHIVDETVARSYDHLAANAPKLEITYTIPTAHEVAITDSLGMLDGVARSQGFKKTISDKLGMLDSVPAPKGAFKIAVPTEKLGMLDTIKAPGRVELEISDSVGLLDSATRRADYKQEAVDSIGMKESVASKAAFHLTVSDVLALLDTTSTKAAFHMAVSDVLGMLDSAARSRGFPITISEILAMRDRLVTRKRRWPLGDLPDDTIQGGA